MKIHLATDHAGLDLKNTIKYYLTEKDMMLRIMTHEYDAEDDYPIGFSLCTTIAEIFGK